jgi:integrase
MLCTYNPMASVKRPDVDPYAHAKGLAPAEIKRLLASCDQATEIGARDYAILLWMLFTARRRGAVTKLTWGDIRDGRTAGMKEYFYQEALDETSLNKLVTRAALRAGFSERDEAAGKKRTWFTVHTLRHTAAQLRLQAGDDILAINQFLDHGSLDVTKIYVNAVSARPDSSWRRVADQIL